VLDRGVFTDFTLRSVFTANFRLAKVMMLCETTKQVEELSEHQVGGRPRSGILEIPETGAIIDEITMPCHNEQINRSSFCNTSTYSAH
jgi:hypothetical protein